MTSKYITKWIPILKPISTKHLFAEKAIQFIEQFDILFHSQLLQDKKDCSALCHSYQRMAELILKTVLKCEGIDVPLKHDLRLLHILVSDKCQIQMTDETALDVITLSAVEDVYTRRISCAELKKNVLEVDDTLDKYIDHLKKFSGFNNKNNE